MSSSILIDPRVGSKDLAQYFLDMDHRLEHLEYGDVCFEGKGRDGCPWTIGIERKRLGDLCSCIIDGRFSGHQLPGLLASYNFVYLIIEDMTKCDLANGLIKLRRGDSWVPVLIGERQMTSNEVMGFLNTVSVMTGVRVWQTGGARETAAYVRWLHHWWNGKEFEEHRSHVAMDRGVQLTPMPFAAKVAAELPGIGMKKARRVADHFVTVENMMTCGVKDWMEVEGIGKTIAERIVNAIRGR